MQNLWNWAKKVTQLRHIRERSFIAINLNTVDADRIGENVTHLLQSIKLCREMSCVAINLNIEPTHVDSSRNCGTGQKVTKLLLD